MLQFLIISIIFSLYSQTTSESPKHHSKFTRGATVPFPIKFHVTIFSSEFGHLRECYYVPNIFYKKYRVVCDIMPICQGGVVNRNWILTAGHCLFNLTIEKLVVGHGDIRVQELNQYEVDYGVLHHGFNLQDAKADDIGLLKLKQSLPIDFAELAIMNFEQLPDRVKGLIYSTGPIGSNSRYSPVLKVAEVITRDFECEASQNFHNTTHKQFCYSLQHSETIPGDSGAPITTFHVNYPEIPDQILIGIHFGTQMIKPGRKLRRGSNVSWYYMWIKYTIYMMDPIDVVESKLYYCCVQEKIDEYLIQSYARRDFATVERFGGGH